MIADVHLPTELSLSLVHEVLGYIHSDLKDIIHKEGNTLFHDNNNNNNRKKRRRLPLSLIMNSGLEDYFEDVLLSSRFKKKLCDECANRGQLDSLKWARSIGCPWIMGASTDRMFVDYGCFVRIGCRLIVGASAGRFLGYGGVIGEWGVVGDIKG